MALPGDLAIPLGLRQFPRFPQRAGGVSADSGPSDLRMEFPDMKGISRSNLFHMRGFAAA